MKLIEKWFVWVEIARKKISNRIRGVELESYSYKKKKENISWKFYEIISQN